MALDCFLTLGHLWKNDQRDRECGHKVRHRPNE
jgi:hypothetical protein